MLLHALAAETSSESIQRRIAELQLEHRGLDAMIDALGREQRFDELQLRRLKKRKLQIKDTIKLLEMQLVPDVPAYLSCETGSNASFATR